VSVGLVYFILSQPTEAAAQRKGAAVIPVAQLSDGSQLALSARKVEQIDQMIFYLVLAVAGFALVELWKIVFGTNRSHSADIQLIKETQATILTKLDGLSSHLGDVKLELDDVRGAMVNEDRVREIAEDRISYVERIRGGR
jgi:hypothetical protein